MQRQIEKARRYLAGTPRVFASALAMLLLSGSLFSMVASLNLVTVTDETGDDLVLLTAAAHPDAILEQAGVETEDTAAIEFTQHSVNTASIVIRRSLIVEVEDNGTWHSAELLEGTVATALALAGVELEGEDFTEPALDEPIEDGMQVTVQRVTYGEEMLQTELDEAEVDAFVATLPEGAPFLYSNAGLYNAVLKTRYVNGELESSEILQLLPVLVPREEGDTSFTPGVPVSRIEGYDDVMLGADGVPTEYTRLMEGAVSTAYSSRGGKGSSGLGLYYGTVAVNPNVIPYGTRMYITSADNSFVYGYAIATDTGTAMMEGRVDIDLYFETNAECLAFGKRGLNVYILD